MTRTNMFVPGTKDFDKPPDAAAKAPMVENDAGLAPWQKELQERKKNGAAAPTWKRKKPEEATKFIDDEDDDDAAALFFSAPETAKPKSQSTSTSATDDDAAALIFAAPPASSESDSDSGDSSTEKQSSMEASSSASGDDGAPNLFHAATASGDTEESETSKSSSASDSEDASEENEIEIEVDSSPAWAQADETSSSGSEATSEFEAVSESLPEDDLSFTAGNLERPRSEYIPYMGSEIFEEASDDEKAEEVIVADDDSEVIEVFEEGDDFIEEVEIEEDEVSAAEETEVSANEDKDLIIRTDDAATADQIVDPKTKAGTSPQNAILAELEFVESRMREFINSVTNDTSAASVPSQQSSIPWMMPSNDDRDSLASYASYVRSTIAEKPSFDGSAYIPARLFDPEIVGITDTGRDIEIADTVTHASSEQSSMPWIIPYRELDSWANPVRELNAMKMKETATDENNGTIQSTAGHSGTISKRSQEDPPQSTPVSSMPRSNMKRPRKELPDSDASVSMQIYRTSVPDPSRDTDLWYHPGFSMLVAQDSKTPARSAEGNNFKRSQDESFNGSADSDKAVISDAEVIMHVYNTSIPKFSRPVRLQEPKKSAAAGPSKSSSSSKNYPSRTASLSKRGEADSRWKHIDFTGTIRRNSFPWVPDDEAAGLAQGLNNESSSAHSQTSSESSSSSSDVSEVFEEEIVSKKVQRAPRSPPSIRKAPPAIRKAEGKTTPKNVVRSKNGRISISLEPQTFTYVPEKEESPERFKRSSREAPAAPATRVCWETMGYVFLCLCLILVPSAIAVTLILTKEDVDRTPTILGSSNDTTAMRLPTSQPTSQAPMSATITGTPTRAPTILPTAALDPTNSPTADDPPPQDLLFRLLASVSSDEGESLKDRSTPQFAAMQWLRTPAGNQGVYNDEIFLQRYVLATVYFATAGFNWDFNNLWLTSSNECEWFSSASNSFQSPCDSSGRIVELNLENNGLQGTIPKEVSHLFQLETLNLSVNPKLTGPVPESIQNLQNLREIFLEDTALTSPLGLCNSMLNLDAFWADCVELGGCECCTECFF